MDVEIIAAVGAKALALAGEWAPLVRRFEGPMTFSAIMMGAITVLLLKAVDEKRPGASFPALVLAASATIALLVLPVLAKQALETRSSSPTLAAAPQMRAKDGAQQGSRKITEASPRKSDARAELPSAESARASADQRAILEALSCLGIAAGTGAGAWAWARRRRGRAGGAGQGAGQELPQINFSASAKPWPEAEPLGPSKRRRGAPLQQDI